MQGHNLNFQSLWLCKYTASSLRAYPGQQIRVQLQLELVATELARTTVQDHELRPL